VPLAQSLKALSDETCRISERIAPEQKALLKVVMEFCKGESLKVALQKLRKFRNGKSCSS
jgi:hypothetical protein